MDEQENKVVALVEPQGNSLTQRMAYAKALSSASLLPADYRNQAANVLMALEYGHELGIGTMTAIQQIHVIKGKPTASAQLIGSLVRTAGHRMRVTGNDEGATVSIWRKDDPDFEFKSVWNATRARAAGLLPAKADSGWEKYPAALYKARAITECAREACAEVLAGVAYTAEELGDESLVQDVVPVRTVPSNTPRLSAVKNEPEQSGWSSRIGIGAVMAAQAANKEEMPTPNSPILDAVEVDEWGVEKVNTSWGDERFGEPEPFGNDENIVTFTACNQCSEPLMTWKEGEKNGKHWGGYFCGNKASKCAPLWYKIDPVTSEWVK